MCDTIDFSSLFDDVSFADIAVRYGHNNYLKVHKAIVCPQSPYLRQGCERLSSQQPNSWAIRWVEFAIKPRFHPEAVLQVFRSFYQTKAQNHEVIQRNDWVLLVNKYEIAQLLGLDYQLPWIREALAMRVQELEASQDRNLPLVKNIIDATPFLKDDFRATLQAMQTEQVMNMLGSFSIGE